MDDDNNLDRSESTEENEERSETETEGCDKLDSDIISQYENLNESRNRECKINIQNYGNRNKSKRPNKSRSNENDKYFLVGLPRDQLKRKLMESVVEKIESSPSKKSNQDSSSHLLTKVPKRRSSFGQLSQGVSATIQNVNSSKHFSVKGNCSNKSLENVGNFVTGTQIKKFKPIPDLSHFKVPLLPLDIKFSLEKFSEDLINLLITYDPADYFQYPLVDHFAPFSFQLTEQIDMQVIKRRLKGGYYSNSLDNLENDLLLLYSNGIHCFNEKSIGWNEAAKLYQTTLVNIQGFKNKLYSGAKILITNDSTQCSLSNDSKIHSDDRATYLNILNPYNKGKINENERIITIGDQIGKLKSGTQNLLGYKEDRRNKVTVLSYLDYGSNFSFGPSYDSGNAYCSKETSDLLIRAYGDNSLEECQYEDLNEIIPDVTFGDDFSLYLMNTLTRDIMKSFRSEESITMNQSTSGKIYIEDNEKTKELSNLQILLNDSWKDLVKLKAFNYQRLSNYQLQPSNDEQNLSEKVMANLTNLILKTNPESVTNLKVIRKALNCV